MTNEKQLLDAIVNLPMFSKLREDRVRLAIYNSSAFSKKRKRRINLIDTIRLFQKAVMVIGPHGGGMANAIFSAPGTLMVEFSVAGSHSYGPPVGATRWSSQTKDSHNLSLSLCLTQAFSSQLEYWAVLGKSSSPDVNKAHRSTMTVGISEVAGLVDCALSAHMDNSSMPIGCSVSLEHNGGERSHTPCGAHIPIPVSADDCEWAGTCFHT